MGDPGVDPRPGLGHRVEGGDPGDAALQKHSYARRSEAGGPGWREPPPCSRPHLGMGCEATQRIRSADASGDDPRFGTAGDGGSRCPTVPAPGTGLGADPGGLRIQ